MLRSSDMPQLIYDALVTAVSRLCFVIDDGELENLAASIESLQFHGDDPADKKAAFLIAAAIRVYQSQNVHNQ